MMFFVYFFICLIISQFQTFVTLCNRVFFNIDSVFFFADLIKYLIKREILLFSFQFVYLWSIELIQVIVFEAKIVHFEFAAKIIRTFAS